MSIYTYDEFKEAIAKGNTTATDSVLLRTFMSKQFLLYFKQRNKELEPTQLYRYMLTFTLPDTHKHDEDVVEAYIIKQLKRKPLKIVEAHLAKEYTKKKTAHWHAVIASTIPLKKDRFSYYKTLYGNMDLSRTKAQNTEKGVNLTEGLNYINKETKSIQIV